MFRTQKAPLPFVPGTSGSSVPTLIIEDHPIQRSTPSVTVNLIKAVRDNGVHAIEELNEQIAELEVRRSRLLGERETIRKMLVIAEEHVDHVQRN